MNKSKSSNRLPLPTKSQTDIDRVAPEQQSKYQRYLRSKHQTTYALNNSHMGSSFLNKQPQEPTYSRVSPAVRRLDSNAMRQSSITSSDAEYIAKLQEKVARLESMYMGQKTRADLAQKNAERARLGLASDHSTLQTELNLLQEALARQKTQCQQLALRQSQLLLRNNELQRALRQQIEMFRQFASN